MKPPSDAPLRRRLVDTRGFCLRADAIEWATELELTIETRFRGERAAGGAHIPLGECDGVPFYDPRGE